MIDDTHDRVPSGISNYFGKSTIIKPKDDVDGMGNRVFI